MSPIWYRSEYIILQSDDKKKGNEPVANVKGLALSHKPNKTDQKENIERGTQTINTFCGLFGTGFTETSV